MTGKIGEIGETGNPGLQGPPGNTGRKGVKGDPSPGPLTTHTTGGGALFVALEQILCMLEGLE